MKTISRPCGVSWCTANADAAKLYCAIHERYAELRKDTPEHSIRALRGEQARQRRLARAKALMEANQRATALNRERLLRRGN